MNEHTPSPPLNVPLLTEVIEPAGEVPPALAVAPDALPVLDAVVDTMTDVPVAPLAPLAPPHAEPPPLLTEPTAVVADMSRPGELPSYDGYEEVPRNLLRSTQDQQPPPMRATVAAPITPAAGGEAALASARASLSEALRSAREGRWAPMPNVEVQQVAPPPEAADTGAAALLIDALAALPAAGDEATPPVTPPLTPTAEAQLDLPDLLEPAPELGERLPHDGIPTDTEPGALTSTHAHTAPADAAALLAASLGPVEVTEVTEPQLAHRVLSVVQKQIDGMIEFRLREALGPILQRQADALVRELRDELKQTMQDVVTRAVAQEMAKVRPR